MIWFYIMSMMIGGCLGSAVGFTTGYHALDSWQWWVITVPLVLITNSLLLRLMKDLL